MACTSRAFTCFHRKGQQHPSPGQSRARFQDVGGEHRATNVDGSSAGPGRIGRVWASAGRNNLVRKVPWSISEPCAAIVRLHMGVSKHGSFQAAPLISISRVRSNGAILPAYRRLVLLILDDKTLLQYQTGKSYLEPFFMFRRK